MNEPIDLKKNKERSPNFPFIPLESALQKAQVFYSHERRGDAPASAAAKHWGYSDTSSAFKQTLAALKSYGLLVDAGGRMVRLTEGALRILLDQRPDSGERDKYLLEAALSPAVASEVFQRWPTGLPSDHTLAHYLIFDRGFQEETAARVAKILRLNDQFAKVSQQDLDDDISTVAPATEQAIPTLSRLDVHRAQAGAEPSHPAGVLARTTQDFAMPPAAVPSQAAPVRSEKIIDPNGMDVTISFGGEPSQETYEFLADYIELRLKQFQRKASRANTSMVPEGSADDLL